jgi:hypothetical protein
VDIPNQKTNDTQKHLKLSSKFFGLATRVQSTIKNFIFQPNIITIFCVIWNHQNMCVLVFAQGEQV